MTTRIADSAHSKSTSYVAPTSGNTAAPTLADAASIPSSAGVVVDVASGEQTFTDTYSLTTDAHGSTVEVHLTQAQTGMFWYGEEVAVQVNWLTPEGARDATTIKTINVGGNLLDRVMEYGN